MTTLAFERALDRPELLAPPVAVALAAPTETSGLVEVEAVDPALADTAAFLRGLRTAVGCGDELSRRGGD
ncbi:hypothetical protein LJR186_003953 [Microbacterium foliorum]|nr:hypothetical protein [Actinomycetota bacterium]